MFLGLGGELEAPDVLGGDAVLVQQQRAREPDVVPLGVKLSAQFCIRAQILNTGIILAKKIRRKKWALSFRSILKIIPLHLYFLIHQDERQTRLVCLFLKEDS